MFQDEGFFFSVNGSAPSRPNVIMVLNNFRAPARPANVHMPILIISVFLKLINKVRRFVRGILNSEIAERPRSPAPDRWRDECRERSDQALGVPAGRCSVDRIVSVYFDLQGV